MTARWTDRAVRSVLGLGGPATDAAYSGVCTDTRSLTPGCLFVALAGERFDAHDFLGAAAAGGAAGAVVRRGTLPVPGLSLYPVDDTL
ncbi:MAG TPA: Mur ligase domain-containing protein, partial [Gemmatimonadales bacterium]